MAGISRRARGFGQPVFDVELQDVWSREQPTSVEEAARDAQGLLPFIVPPTFAKVPYFENDVMRALWEFARRGLESASNIYCIGYSLPAGDDSICALLATYGAGKTVLPVNRDHQATNHYEEMLPGSRADATYVGGDDIIKQWAVDYTNKLRD